MAQLVRDEDVEQSAAAKESCSTTSGLIDENPYDQRIGVGLVGAGQRTVNTVSVNRIAGKHEGGKGGRSSSPNFILPDHARGNQIILGQAGRPHVITIHARSGLTRHT